jgi:hypothetical protein
VHEVDESGSMGAEIVVIDGERVVRVGIDYE